MQHPQRLFNQAVESVQVDATNFQILKEHIICAAYEIPIEKIDEEFFGTTMAKGVNSLAKEGNFQLLNIIVRVIYTPPPPQKQKIQKNQHVKTAILCRIAEQTSSTWPFIWPLEVFRHAQESSRAG